MPDGEMVYQWRPGYRYKVPAAVAGTELERIRAQSGNERDVVAAAMIVAAKPESSPLHREFNWNDKAAAHEHRMDQARNLITALCYVVRREPDGEPVRTVAYVHVRSADNPSTYRTAADVLRDPEDSANSLKECISLLRGIHRRFLFLAEFHPQVRLIFNAIKRLEDLLDDGP